MSYQSPSKLALIFEMIQQLLPSERRQLLRRLHASGLLERDELLTDQNQLEIAPALGGDAGRQPANTTAMIAVDEEEGPASNTIELDQTLSGDKKPVLDPYQSAVSGKVVVGPLSDVDADDPHAMRPVPGQAPEQPIVVIFDGGSKGNPGMGYGSYALRWPGQTEQIVQLQFGDYVTNNEAEYDTLIAALDTVLGRLDDLGAETDAARLMAYGDSLLVINQINGEWKCKNERLLPRRDEARSLLEQFGHWQLIHHDRSKSVEVLGH